MIRVRAAHSADLPRVLRLWAALSQGEQALGVPIRTDDEAAQGWLASFERHLGRFSHLWVAERDGDVLGFLLARLKSQPPYVGSELVGEIASIFIDPAMRGTGSGQTLVETAIAALKAAGATVIEVQAHESNADARAFWESQGFRAFARTYRLDEGGRGAG